MAPASLMSFKAHRQATRSRMSIEIDVGEGGGGGASNSTSPAASLGDASPEAGWRLSAKRLAEVLRRCGEGSVLRGWRRELDPEGTLAVPFKRLCSTLGRWATGEESEASQASQGRSKLVLVPGELDRLSLGELEAHFGHDGRYRPVRLEDLAPEASAAVVSFRCWAKETFDNHSLMFQAFFPDEHGRVTREVFLSTCRQLNVAVDQEFYEELFAFCDVDNMGWIREEKMIFLEVDRRLLKMNQKEKRQQLLLAMYEDGKAVPPRHRLAARPWLEEALETALPVVVSDKRKQRRKGLQRRGMEARDKFILHLRSAYGTELRGWRLGLDPKASWDISFRTISQYCSKAHVGIDVHDLWRLLDLDSDNVIGLEELCPGPAVALATFQKWADTTFGSCAAVWEHPSLIKARQSPGWNGAWRSDKKMFAKTFSDVLRTLGWPTSTEHPDVHAKVLESFDLYGCGFIERSDLEWLDMWDAPQWLCADPDPAAWERLKSLILAKYKHPLKAWRMLLDRDDTNCISWGEFRKVAREFHFRREEAASCWRCLDHNHSGTISMQNFDAGTADILESFKTWVECTFGSMTRAFKALDGDGNGVLSFGELKYICQKLNWEGSVRMLFDCLDINGRRGAKGQEVGIPKRYLSLKEIAFLDQWKVHEDFEEDGVGLVGIDDWKWKDAPTTHRRSLMGQYMRGSISKSTPLLPRSTDAHEDAEASGKAACNTSPGSTTPSTGRQLPRIAGDAKGRDQRDLSPEMIPRERTMLSLPAKPGRKAPGGDRPHRLQLCMLPRLKGHDGPVV